MQDAQKAQERDEEESKLKQVCAFWIWLCFLVFLIDGNYRYLPFVQKLAQSKLNGFVRPVSSSDARPLHDGETHPKWKFQATQADCLNRAVAEWIIGDTLHPAAIDGAGFTDLMKIAEPRYVLPSSQYFKTVFLDFLFVIFILRILVSLFSACDSLCSDYVSRSIR